VSLFQLMYVSTKNPMPPTEIFRIQEQAQRNNARGDLTGVLLFNRDYFLQCLEGEREQVTHAFTVIARDDRHRQVNLLCVRDIAERSYPDWSMGMLDGTSPSLRNALNDVLPGGLFMPDNLTADTAMLVTQRMRTLHFTR
jgi:Sensors of blue-light using FAD